MAHKSQLQPNYQLCFNRILFVLMILSFIRPVILGQESTWDNFTGSWTDNPSWTDNSSPGIVIDGSDIDIYGKISLDTNLVYDAATLTIHDTLIIYGNLALENNAILTIETGGILIVNGDYYSENRVEVTSGGTLVVTGEFTMTGAVDQGSFVNDGSIFIFDDIPEIKLGAGYTDLLCDDPTDYPANCAYGDEIDITLDPVNDLFVEVTCSQNDSIAPVMTLPVLTPVGSPDDIPPVYNNYNALITAGGTVIDDCTINKASFAHISDVSDNNSCPETIVRTYAISDKAGNTCLANQMITLVDNIKPALILPLVPNILCIDDVPAPYTSLTELTANGGSASDNNALVPASFALVSADTMIIGNMFVIVRMYEISDICGNTKTSSQDITVRDFILPYVFCPADTMVCADNELGAVVNNIDPLDYYDNCTSSDDLALTYTISGTTNSSGTGDASGIFFNNGISTITYSVTDRSGNTSSESFTVTVNPQPVSSEIIGIGSPLCEASSQSYSITADPASEFLWTVPSDAEIVTDTAGSGISTIEVNFGYNGGYVTVTETDGLTGCNGETKYLEIGLIGCPLIADFSIDKSTPCPMDSVTVVSTSSGISLNTQYHWDFGENAYPSVASGPGPHKVSFHSSGSRSIQLRVEDKSVETSTKEIQVGSLPDEFLGPDQDICEGESYIFTPTEPCAEYLWHDGSVSGSYEATNTETIWVAVVDNLGCAANDTVEITVHANPVVDLGDDHEICDPEGEDISVGDFALYNWSTGDISNNITVYPDAGTIALTVTDWNNCKASDQLIILSCTEVMSVIDVPGIISPNGDGIQDTWIINGIELYPDARIQVFDLYGRKVFQVNHNYANEWNGNCNGISLPAGRYFYIIDFLSSDLQPITGSVSIIH